MKNLLLKQKDGFFIMTESAWDNHLQMVKMCFLQEEPNNDPTPLVNDYKESFTIEQLTKKQVDQNCKRFGITINETRKIDSFFGYLLHF